MIRSTNNNSDVWLFIYFGEVSWFREIFSIPSEIRRLMCLHLFTHWHPFAHIHGYKRTRLLTHIQSLERNTYKNLWVILRAPFIVRTALSSGITIPFIFPHVFRWFCGIGCLLPCFPKTHPDTSWVPMTFSKLLSWKKKSKKRTK